MEIKNVRIDAIDVFRGLTMFFMLWVNSFWSLSEVPHWLQHATKGEDMLGFSDIIFPGFLFIMGASVPLAIENRMAKGDSIIKLLWHIGSRSVALVAMGLLTVNFGDAYGAEQTGMARSTYALLMVLGCFLVWNFYPKAGLPKRVLFVVLQVLGVALLVYLSVVFRGSDGSQFGVRWWGILGRIGWTYLFCAIVYLLIKKKLMWNIVVVVLLIAGSCLQAAKILPTNVFPNNLTIFAYGSSGVVLSILIERYADKVNPKRFYYILFATAVMMLVAGAVSHNYWIISKVAATPTWYFYCCAIFFPMFAILYYLTDVKGKTGWFNWVKPAGAMALSCYLFAYAWNPLKGMIFSNPLLLPKYSIGVLGLLNSFCYSMLLIWMVWLLSRWCVRLKV